MNDKYRLKKSNLFKNGIIYFHSRLLNSFPRKLSKQNKIKSTNTINPVQLSQDTHVISGSELRNKPVLTCTQIGLNLIHANPGKFSPVKIQGHRKFSSYLIQTGLCNYILPKDRKQQNRQWATFFHERNKAVSAFFSKTLYCLYQEVILLSFLSEDIAVI